MAMKTGPNDMILAVVWAYSVCFFKNHLFFITNNFILHLVLPCQEPPSPHPSLAQNARQRGVSTLPPPSLETQDGGGSPTLSCDGKENWPDNGEIRPNYGVPPPPHPPSLRT